MGNGTSKTNKNTLPLARTDTGSSAKSSRSIRSRISLLKDDSTAQLNSNINSSNSSPKHTPRILSRKNSSTNTDQLPNNEEPKDDHEEINQSMSNLNLNNLPPSMMKVEPKTPILLRRNTDENISNPQSPRRFSVTSQSSNNHNELSRSSTNHSVTNHSLHYPLTPQETISIDQDKSAEDDLNEVPNDEVSNSNSLTKYQSVTTNNENPNTIDIEDLIQRLLDAGYLGKRTKSVCLKNSEIQLICSNAREIFLSQPSLLELSPPVKVVGDVHGQYSDLIRIFTKCGFPPQTNYLFLGDYVDRGKQSLETILLLLCYKIKYPENFFLLRGNHECANVTRVYGFYDECKRRCNIKTWKLFIDTFNTLPIAAIVAGKIFCVHGGLSPVLNSMDEIRNIARPTDVPDYGLLNDLLWSDPADTLNEWEDNERGVSYVFSKIAINKFLSKFGFDLVCRAHMVVEDGYEFFNDRTLVTVFLAPNYCGEFDNWGAVMSVSEELLCLFELLDPLDSAALKQVMKKGKQERRSAQLQQQSK